MSESNYKATERSSWEGGALFVRLILELRVRCYDIHDDF